MVVGHVLGAEAWQEAMRLGSHKRIDSLFNCLAPMFAQSSDRPDYRADLAPLPAGTCPFL